jgi:FG-GAP-like repeat
MLIRIVSLRDGLLWPLILLSLLGLAAAAWAWRVRGERRPPAPLASVQPPPEAAPTEASHEVVARTCGGCHAFPPPETFPKDHWPHEVRRGFTFLKEAHYSGILPSIPSVIAYFQRRAPEALPVLQKEKSPAECPVRLERTGFRTTEGGTPPALSNVGFVHLSDERKLDVLACDMVNGRVLLLRPYEPGAKFRVVSNAILNPAHAEVVDLDRDGIKDLVVANLGFAFPTDKRFGSVVWLRGGADGSYRPFTLAGGLGRVADVQAADFDGDGDLDLIVAEFGWLETGGILLLENRTTAAENHSFAPSTVDGRHGAIHVPVADLNGDGRPDFVAVISQEHESVVAYLNEGHGHFLPREIYAAPHPAFGSSGIQLVDLDRDGDLDVLMSNGDSLDSHLLRPYHGVQWLENRGTYPFEAHPLTSLYGAHRAVAADMDGDGDLDIVAVNFLPGSYYENLSREMELDAAILLEQVAPGHFVRHSIETIHCVHPSCDLGDYDADGRPDLVVANSFIRSSDDASEGGPDAIEERAGADGVVLWRNLGRTDAKDTSTPERAYHR